MTDDAALPEKVANSFQQLKAIAAQLNDVSRELGKQIAALDQTLQFLNLGVPTWVLIRGGDSDDGQTYWLLELGYAKVGSTWGVAVREREGAYRDDSERGDLWLFANAPRVFRAEAVDKLPDLLEQLIKEATKTTGSLRAKVSKANQIVKAFSEPPKVTAGMQRQALSGADIAGDVARAVLKHDVDTIVAGAAMDPRALLNAKKK